MFFTALQSSFKIIDNQTILVIMLHNDNLWYTLFGVLLVLFGLLIAICYFWIN